MESIEQPTTFSVNSNAFITSHGKASNGVLSQSDFCLIAATISKMSQILAIMNTRSIVISIGEIEYSECRNPLGVISWVQYLQIIKLIELESGFRDVLLFKRFLFNPFCHFDQLSYHANLMRPEMKLNNAMIMAPV